jgi:hypothetical protein
MNTKGSAAIERSSPAGPRGGNTLCRSRALLVALVCSFLSSGGCKGRSVSPSGLVVEATVLSARIQRAIQLHPESSPCASPVVTTGPGCHGGVCVRRFREAASFDVPATFAQRTYGLAVCQYWALLACSRRCIVVAPLTSPDRPKGHLIHGVPGGVPDGVVQ